MPGKRFAIAGWLAVTAISIIAFYLASMSLIPLPRQQVGIAPSILTFSGARAHELAVEFATRFTGRHSGTASNREGAPWVKGKLNALGYETRVDNFAAILYGRMVPLQNVVGVKRGHTPQAIAVVAHVDQARTTVQGADNDASGIGIMLHLAELFRGQETRYTLVFLATDAEEYGKCWPSG